MLPVRFIYWVKKKSIYTKEMFEERYRIAIIRLIFF